MGRLQGLRTLFAEGFRSQAADHAGGGLDHAGHAGERAVELLGQFAGLPRLGQAVQFLGEDSQGGLVRQAVLVPALQLRDGARNQFDHRGVVRAAPQHAADRCHEGQQDEGQQGDHEEEGGQAFPAPGAGGLAGLAGCQR
ncbi:hypothetical protein D9M70_558790 [compost metagenome]